MANNIQDLAERFLRSSEEKDFMDLYKRIKPGLLNHCRSILIDEETSEDALSNTMTKIWTKMSQYDPLRGNFSTWAYNIARNESLLIKKVKSRYMPLISESIKNNDSDDASIVYISGTESFSEPNWNLEDSQGDLDSLYDSVVHRMKDLPEIYKEILIDREINKMKYQDIAEKHGMKKRAVATRIRRARLKVREMFPNAKLNFID
jgi:RNA polymerase sigma-70 factor (ECF subfamily)